jgi:putative FmdB family regulatory protein
MPFYEYECQACGEHHEALQKISDAPLKKCPHCGKARLKKLVSAPVFRLKGGGWYETDFKSDGEKKRNLAGDDKPAGDDSKAPAAKPPKTDPAPAASPAPAPAKASTAKSRPKAKAKAKAKAPAKRR